MARLASGNVEQVRRFYPANWKSIVAAVRERDGFRCTQCGAEHLKPHPETGARVILHTAHLNHDYEPDADHTDLSRFAAMCQRCHNRYDAVNRTNTKREHYGPALRFGYAEGGWKPKGTRKTARRWTDDLTPEARAELKAWRDRSKAMVGA